MFRTITFLILWTLAWSASAQQYVAEKSSVVFYSDAPLEAITGKNSKSIGILDLAKEQFAFEVPVKDFEFAKSLMKEHFNEKYLETEKYPKSQFSGKLTGLNKDIKGVQNVVAVGKLLIHGITQEVSIPGTIEFNDDNKLVVKSKFMVKVADYKITIPQLVWQNIAEQVEVTIEFLMKSK